MCKYSDLELGEVEQLAEEGLELLCFRRRDFGIGIPRLLLEDVVES